MAESRTKPTKAKSSDSRIEKMLKVITKGLNLTNQRLDHMEKASNQHFERVEEVVEQIHRTVIKIENDHGYKAPLNPT